jgi:large repetitive protein
MRRRCAPAAVGLVALLASVALLAPAAALGERLPLLELRTLNNFLFDVLLESNMGMSNGLGDAYDGCYMLRVAGAEVLTPSVTFLFAGRGVASPRIDLADGLRVSRQVYMPADADWARYYDLVINPSKTSRTVTVEIFGNLGSDSATKVTGTSDGDLAVEPSDAWIATDDFADGEGDPSLAHVFRHQGSKLSPSRVTLESDNLSVEWDLKLAPQGRAAILFYAVQTKNSAEAARVAAELVKLDAKARAHLSPEDLRLVRN